MRELYGIFSSFLRTAGVLTATAWYMLVDFYLSDKLSQFSCRGFLVLQLLNGTQYAASLTLNYFDHFDNETQKLGNQIT